TTDSSYGIGSATARDAGQYDVVINGSCGSVTSSVAVLTVNARTVASPLANPTNNLGTSITFATLASGTGPLAYVWKKNGTNVAGATTPAFTLKTRTFDTGR